MYSFKVPLGSTLESVLRWQLLMASALLACCELGVS